MANVHLFNPENDVALGYWKSSFTLSPLVSSLHRDGASLPMWYAGPGDFVFDPYASETAEWYGEVSRRFGLDVTVADSVPSGLKGMPWGWSYDTCRQFAKIGVEVPDGEWLERHRQLSHRRLTAKIMARLSDVLPFSIPAVPCEAESIEDVRAKFGEWEGRIFVKAPWSSSGRGVMYVGRWTDTAETRIRSVIRRQGSVMCEPAVDKYRDFAMEFHSDGRHVEWVAYSLFFNEHGASYSGNILAPDFELERMLIADGADKVRLESVKSALVDIFNDMIAPYYEGYFGVDMMIATDGMIVPCVEVNLRMTMGVVASLWRDRYMSDGSRGRYFVGMKRADICRAEPIIFDRNRMVNGRMCLTPPRRDGKFEFVVEVSEL